MARTTLSTKASCPRPVFFTSAARPSKLPSCSGFVSAVPLASRPSASMSRSIRRLSSSAVCTPASCAFSRAFCCLSKASSCFCCSSSAAFRSGRPLPAGFSGCGFSGCGCAPPNFSLPPAPNTPFIKLSQSSVYAMVLPSIGVFSSSIVNCAAFCKHKKAPPFGGADIRVYAGIMLFSQPLQPCSSQSPKSLASAILVTSILPFSAGASGAASSAASAAASAAFASSLASASS